MIASGTIVAHVFKSSQTTAEIGLAIGRMARQTPFRELVAHMEGLLMCQGIHYTYIVGKKIQHY